MQLKIKRMNPKAKLPFYAHEGDAGMDLVSIEDKLVQSGEIALISTGLAIELPPNTEAQIRPRSGLALKHGIALVNSPGTIDEGYRGEIKIILINHGKEDFLVEQGMRIAQMVIKPVLRVDIVETVDDLSVTERNIGGFGSSGTES